MTNKDYINAYKSDDKIITDYYKIRQNNKLIDVVDIINPLKIDNRQLISPIDDQAESPHCAGYSAATIIESIYWKETGKLLQLDSHQVYALAKQLDGSVNMDGTYLEYAMRSVLQLCKNDSRFDFLSDAKIELFYNDRTDNTIENTKFLIHKHDFLQVGFQIDQGWNMCTNSNYILREFGQKLGGHAVVICGYDSDGFYICNQWGNWGSKGFALMPYNVFKNEFMYGVYLNNLKN